MTRKARRELQFFDKIALRIDIIRMSAPCISRGAGGNSRLRGYYKGSFDIFMKGAEPFVKMNRDPAKCSFVGKRRSLPKRTQLRSNLAKR